MIKRIAFLILFLLHNILAQAPTPFFIYSNNTPNKEVYCINAFVNSKSFFNQVVFDTPLILEHAKQKQYPVIFFCPSKLDGYSPLDDVSIWLEGVRVALTWLSIFFNGAKCNWYIIQSNKEPTNSEQLRVIETLMHKAIDRKLRHIPITSLLKESTHPTGILRPLSYQLSTENSVIVQPLLSQKEACKKRFLITGIAGFIGSHLAQTLLNEGHQVIGLDNFSCSNKKNIQGLMENDDFHFSEHDVAQPIEINGPIDYILHLASIPSPSFYYQMPKETMNVGLNGTRNMLHLAIQKNAQFLFASTSEVYGDPVITPQEENYPGNVNPLGKRSQYDQSKRGAETLIKIYAEHYGIDARIARIFNTYGPNMQLHDGRVVTNFINALLHHKPMIIYGDGKQTRSFSYIDDTIQGLLKLIHADIPNSLPIKERVFNIGNTEELTIEELANMLNIIAPSLNLQPVAIQHIPAFDTTDPKQRKPNLKKAHAILGYIPQVSLRDGIAQTISYFKQGFHEA